ncbi:hypothetical protein QAD02_004563 [Eretmocerus hayati]|uniref:Uncharacterized protein n=1 Tax=Eretmocerus hayati TaxID=131215 RepID=A0ACC2NRR8_9HYME|nr:hypothetical protein QAD02_004563 [Eretmocerus hayati]
MSSSNETSETSEHEDEESSMSISNDEESSLSYFWDDDYGDVSYSRIRYKWQIKNFSKEYSKASIGDLWRAPMLEDMSHMCWFLTIYPKGASKKFKDYMSLHINVEYQRVNVTVLLFIINKDGKEVNMITTGSTRFKSRHYGHFFYHFIKLDELFRRHDLLPNDTLTIGFEVLYNMNLCEIHETQSLDEYEELFINPKYSDITFLVEGKEILAHKAIIASKSPVFAAMFEHKMKENFESIVKVTDFSFIVMYELLRFIYAGKVKDIASIATDLLMASEKYLIERLKLLCEIQLGQDICFKNLGEYLNLANVCNSSHLKSRCCNFIRDYREAIFDTPISKYICEVDKSTWELFLKPDFSFPEWKPGEGIII